MIHLWIMSGLPPRCAATSPMVDQRSGIMAFSDVSRSRRNSLGANNFSFAIYQNWPERPVKFRMDRRGRSLEKSAGQSGVQGKSGSQTRLARDAQGWFFLARGKRYLFRNLIHPVK